jgi:hypothetical protein
MSLDAWMRDARADAERRGLPDLVPLLETLRQVLARIRAADWNDELGRHAPAAGSDRTNAARPAPE